MEFKILAVKINAEFSYIKNLKPNVFYKFFNDYEFVGYDEKTNDFNSITAIKRIGNYPRHMYDIKRDDGTVTNVNISAILGKNGSGKSTVLELMYLLVFCLSERKGYLQLRSFNQQEGNRFTGEYQRELRKNIDDLLEKSKLELYYELNNKYYLMTNTSSNVVFYKLDQNKEEWKGADYNKSLFFYTIGVNYSLYALNSSDSHFWLTPLFHKNDGYKTPLVLNPFRKRGVIDINTEHHLAQTRVLTNLVNDAFESKTIIDKKEIKTIRFDIIPDRIGWIDEVYISLINGFTKDNNKDVDLVQLFTDFINDFDQHVTGREGFSIKASESFLNAELIRKTPPEYRFKDQQPADKYQTRRLLALYILTKIVKICMKYGNYRPFTTLHIIQEKTKEQIRVIRSTKGLVKKLLDDNTHVTLKLKQATNIFLYGYFVNFDWENIRNPEKRNSFMYRASIGFDKFKEIVNDTFAISSHKKKELGQFVPVAFFKPALMVGTPESESDFQHLSSGEQQMVHAIHTILYHILNLESLKNSPSGNAKSVAYHSVNLVLDEIELYYHPEYQRSFVKRLLEELGKLRLKLITGINIIFSTHSPFILSDIPHTNVLKIRDGEPIEFQDENKTFGSNIHEMLADSFFLENDLIGAFAKEQIEDCIYKLTFLNLSKEKKELELIDKPNDYENRRLNIINEELQLLKGADEKLDYDAILKNDIPEINKIIKMIGEPVVRTKLLEMYDEILTAQDQKKEKAKREIEQLMKENGIKKDDL